MATELLMPKLGLTMEQGTIIEWLVADGDTVETGAAILRIETDKTETEVEATAPGRLHVIGRPGDTFGCGERIGWLLAQGEDSPASVATPTGASTESAPMPTSMPTPMPTSMPTSAPVSAPGTVGPSTSAGGRILASPLAKRLAAERNLDLSAARGTGPHGRIVAADIDDLGALTLAAANNAVPGVPASTGGVWPATAAARQLADLLGIDVAGVPLDPVDGYVTRECVARHVRALLAAAAAAAVPVSAAPGAVVPAPAGLPPATQTPAATIRLTGMRGTIAKRMRQSLTQMAQLTLFMDADLDAVVADRSRRGAQGRAPSYTDYVIAAAARALTQHPLANSQITDDGVALLPTVHVGMAVALDGGLIVPVITNTATRDLASLSAESSRLATAARAGTLQFGDLEGGTFSVSTLGMFGVDGFTPVINPPNTCILGVGRLRSDLVLDPDGTIVTRQRITLSLTWDHRAFDGAPAAAFCASIVALLNDPDALDAPAI